MVDVGYSYDGLHVHWIRKVSIVTLTPTSTQMDRLSRIAAVTQTLQQDLNLIRIKKLLLYVCRNQWTTDNETVKQIDLTALIEEVYFYNPSLEHIQVSLDNTIKRINKKAEYMQIAQILLAKLTPLYEETSTSSQGVPPSPVAAQESMMQEPAASTGWSQFQLGDYDAYDLRCNVMRHTNPLRAKIILFTALNYPVELSYRGVATLQRQSIDQLVKEILDSTATPMELETKLRDGAAKLENSDDNTQTVGALLQTLKPLYVCVPPPQPYSANLVSDGGLGTQAMSPSPGSLDWLDSQGSTEAPDDLSQDQFYSQPYAESYEQAYSQSYEDPNYAQDLGYAQHGVPPANDNDDRSVEPASHPVPSPAPLQIATFNNEDIKLGKWLQQVVDNHTPKLMITIENALSELGNQLDERLHEEDPSDYLSLKHQVLQAFLKDIEAASPTFSTTVRRLEASERKLLQPDIVIAPIEDSNVENQFSHLRQVLAANAIVQQQPSLDEDLKRYVRRTMGIVKTGVDQSLSELSNDLDEALTGMSIDEGLGLKYRALRVLVREINQNSAKFDTLLTKMEEAERKLFGI